VTNRVGIAYLPSICVWVRRCEQLSFLRFVPVDNEIARLAVRLAGTFNGDPADRMVVATALFLGADLVTKDRAIRSYTKVHTVW